MGSQLATQAPPNPILSCSNVGLFRMLRSLHSVLGIMSGWLIKRTWISLCSTHYVPIWHAIMLNFSGKHGGPLWKKIKTLDLRACKSIWRTQIRTDRVETLAPVAFWNAVTIAWRSRWVFFLQLMLHPDPPQELLVAYDVIIISHLTFKFPKIDFIV